MTVPQRNLRDLAMNARINWEVPWAQVPAKDKAKLFEVVSTSNDHSTLATILTTIRWFSRRAISTLSWVALKGIGLQKKSLSNLPRISERITTQTDG
jgi:hypothetical protein